MSTGAILIYKRCSLILQWIAILQSLKYNFYQSVIVVIYSNYVFTESFPWNSCEERKASVSSLDRWSASTKFSEKEKTNCLFKK